MGKRELKEGLIKQPMKAWVYWIISLIAFVFAIGLYLFIRKGGIDITGWVIIVFCLAISAVTAMFGGMRSFGWYKKDKIENKTSNLAKKTKKKSARRSLELGGPILAFVLILYVLAKLAPLPEASSFDFTLYLKDSAGRTVIENQGALSITLTSDTRTEKIREQGKVTFFRIPAEFKTKKQTVRLEMKDINGWQFQKTHMTVTQIDLANESPTLVIERDDSLCCIYGSVVDSEQKVIIGATVSGRGFSAQTDEVGRFNIKIPLEYQTREIALSIYKQGFKLWEATVCPETKEEVKVLLKRDEN